MQAADPSLVSVNLAPLWPAAPCQKIPWSTVISIATSTAEHGPTVGLGIGVGLAVGVATLVGVARPVGVAVAPFDVVAVAVSPGPPVVGTGVLDDSPHPTRTATSASAPNADSRARPARFGRMPRIFLSPTVDGHSLPHRTRPPSRAMRAEFAIESDEAIQATVRGYEVELPIGALTPAGDVQPG